MGSLIESPVVAQEIYIHKYLHPDDTLSETMARLPYTMLSNILGLSYGNSTGIFSSDQKDNTISLSDSYQAQPDLVNEQLAELIGQVEELALVYAAKEEHVSVGQFCHWAGITIETFEVLKEYVQLFHNDKLVFYTLPNPYGDPKKSIPEEFIATPDTAKELWGTKQFQKPTIGKKKK